MNEPQILCSSWTRLPSFQYASVLASNLQRHSTNEARQLHLCLKTKANPRGWSITVLGRTLQIDGLCSLWTQLPTFTKVETHSSGPRGHDPCYSCFCLGVSVSSISTRRQGHPHLYAPSISSILHTHITLISQSQNWSPKDRSWERHCRGGHVSVKSCLANMALYDFGFFV